MNRCWKRAEREARMSNLMSRYSIAYESATVKTRAVVPALLRRWSVLPLQNPARSDFETQK
jgi:hypothetical protein